MSIFLIINPSLVLDLNFIDYPYLIGYNAYAIRSFIENMGCKADIFDSFLNSTPKSINDQYKLGTYVGLTEKIIEYGPEYIVILNSPFLRLFDIEINTEIVEICRTAHKNNIKVILSDCFIGGSHFVDYDANIMRSRYGFDYVFKQESEKSFESLIRKTSMDNIPKCMFMQDLDLLPHLTLSESEVVSLNMFYKNCQEIGMTDLIQSGNLMLPMFTSRGCIFNCTFCSSGIGERRFRMHSLSRIDADLDRYHRMGIKTVILMDDLLNPNKERINKLAEMIFIKGMECLIPNGLRADLLERDTIRILKKITPWMKVSAETASINGRRYIGKSLDLECIKTVAKVCKEESLPLYIHYMIGLPGEDITDINTTLRFAKQMHIDYKARPLLQLASPIPGTRLQKDSGLIGSDYLAYFKGQSEIVAQASYMADMFRSSIEILEKRDRTDKIIINLTYNCNNNCIMCAIGDRRGKEGNLAQQIEFIRESRERGITSMDIDGGEPTISADLIKLIDYSRSLGYDNINLTTNGRLLSDFKGCKNIMDSGITSLLISLHGSKARTHEAITRTEGSFLETIQAINNVVLIRKEMMTERNKLSTHMIIPDFGVNITLVRNNSDDLLHIIKLLRFLGVRKVNIQNLTPFGTADSSMVIKREEMIPILSQIIDNQSNGLKINLINFQPCYLGEKITDRKDLKNIDWKGDLGKNSREMMFIDRHTMNLAGFLSESRYKNEECDRCVHDTICEGFWRY